MSNDQAQETESENGAKISRRTAISMMVAGAGASALPWVAASASVLETTTLAQQVNVIGHREVVSFHMDLPYLDTTGLAMPYIPPTFTDRNYDAALCDEALMWANHC